MCWKTRHLVEQAIVVGSGGLDCASPPPAALLSDGGGGALERAWRPPCPRLGRHLHAGVDKARLKRWRNEEMNIEEGGGEKEKNGRELEVN